MDLFNKFKKAVGESSPEPDNLFFTEYNVNGYFSKSDFIDYIKSINKHQFDHLETLFGATSIKSKIANILKPKMDPKTQEFIIWCHIQYVKGTVKLPIPHHEGILRFLLDYQQTDVWFEGDLETLLLEAGLNFSGN